MKSYYCFVESVFRRTPCVHEGCRRLGYQLIKPKKVQKVKSDG
jgi:hypothetical protein